MKEEYNLTLKTFEEQKKLIIEEINKANAFGRKIILINYMIVIDNIIN